MFRHFLLLLAIYATEAQCADKLPSSDYCSCIASMPRNFSGKRDGAGGFSVIVSPSEKRISSNWAEPGWDVDWRDGRSDIDAHIRVTSSDGAYRRQPVTSMCTFNANERRVEIDEDKSQKNSLIAVISDEIPDQRKPWLWIKLQAQDKGSLCSLAARAIWSAEFIDGSTQLTLVSVSKDRKSFIYSDGHGTMARGALHEDITPGGGRVHSISATAVEIFDLLPDGAGGWMERKRVLRLGKPEDKTLGKT